jgi:hypothetical protein
MALTVDFSRLEQAIKTMGADLIEFEVSNKVIPIEPIDKQLGEGFEVSFEDIEFETGLASYQGRQVLLYIKDHSYNNKIYGVLKDGALGNKFHVADCKMLDQMRKKGRFERYVVTNKLDGQFSVTGTDKITNQLIEGDTNLNVCQFCLESLNYEKFKEIPKGQQRKTFVTTFKLADFFDTYSSFFKFMPTGVSNNSNLGYSKDWDSISRNVRERFKYGCQQCGLDLRNNKRLLHVHHINGVKSDNSTSNLTPLCADCHRKQPDHQHMFIKHEETKVINQLRNVQGLNVKENWQDVYNLADPGMHGVIDLLEKYHISLPEVGEKIENNKHEFVAELELAWPLKKVGIAIDKPEAIAATKQGWKVYSMRLAIIEIEQLAISLR